SASTRFSIPTRTRSSVPASRAASSRRNSSAPFPSRSARCALLPGLLPDPGVHAALEHVERQRTGTEQVIVEGADVEPLAEPRLGTGPELADLQLPDLVRERLARVADVAVDLVHDVELGLRGVVEKEIDGLLPRPALRVDAGVHDQPHGAPHFVGERTEPRVRVP